jgi:CubicO group peptidase (beta-lactamase class C family)
VINPPGTIFEAGSVSKQFTAAAVLLLAREGKLSLDDPARKYLPEIPDYGAPLTVRHMLQHTSGLRDWGEVMSISGWPRTSRVYTQAHVLDIVSRQRALNFPSGSTWSYCNTGYNLAAILVSRVSGQSFAEFTRARLFQPLGMTHTSWRDDFTRIVRGRATAYGDRGGQFSTNMPFENVHGNGGLLTTVGDLLAWNENFATMKVGDAAFVQEQQQPGRFTDGRSHDYGLGLYIGRYKGLSEVYHSGSTAGYRAFLTRFPDQRVSVAVLCNVSTGAAERYAHAVADLYLGDRAKDPAPVKAAAVEGSALNAKAGLYSNTVTGTPLSLVREKDLLRVEGGTALVPLSDSRFVAIEGGRTVEFDGGSRVTIVAPNGTSETYARVEPAKPTLAAIGEYAGVYTSADAEVTMTAVVEGGELKLKRRPDTVVVLRPLYADAFAGSLGTILFRRGPSGAVIGLSVVVDRVWNMPFDRMAATR